MRNGARILTVLTAILLAFPLPVAATNAPPTRALDPGPTFDAPHDTFQPGDVFVGANSGKVEWRLPDGTLNKIMDTGTNSEMTGMAFDFAGNLYATAFGAQQIFKFDTHGNLVGPWGSGFNADPESIVFNADGIAYVGQADGLRRVLKFLPDGTLIDTFAMATEDRGTDWLDLASDQCLIRYTSEGTQIKQFDACTRTQLPDWGVLPDRPNIGFALRMIGDDTVLVADWMDIRWVDSNGGVIRTFDAPNQDNWFALNLDPDGKTFWSANYFTGVVHRFDLTTGAVVSTFTSTTARASGLAVFGEFHAGATRDCDSEDISGAFGQINPTPATSERVTVKYDARMLAQQDSIAIAQAMAQKVKDRAEATLLAYQALDLPIPAAVRVDIKCHVGFLWFERDGRVGERGVLDLKVDMIRNELADAAKKGFPPGEAWNNPGKWWKDTIDHELFHIVQYETANLAAEVLEGNHTKLESMAVAGEDLIADVDDIAATYNRLVGEFADLRPHASLRETGLPSDDSYRAASVLQYWGERYGPPNDPNLEHRVAQFLMKVMTAPNLDQTHDFGATIGYNWTTNTYGDADPVTALRDYYLAHYALRANNVSASSNAAYAILDAETGHGLAAGHPALNQAVYPPFNMLNRQLTIVPGVNTFSLPLDRPMSGDVWEFTFPAGTTDLAFHLDTSALGGFRTAIVPVKPNEMFTIDPDLMFSGPTTFSPIDKPVRVLGAERVALVMVLERPWFGGNLELKVTPLQGAPGVTFLAPAAHQLRTATSGPIVFNVRATIAGQPVTGDLPRSVFGVRAGATVADVRTVDFRGDSYHIEAWAPASLGAGTYPLTLTFNGQDFAGGNLVIGPTAPRTTQQISAATTAPLGQGQTASASAPVTPGASLATFHIQWPGSTFDLTLTSPGGRIIPSTSTDPDVTVVRTATTLDMTVATPQAGVWSWQMRGTTVPVPEPVTYALTEADAPLAGSLFVAGQGQAGLPIDAQLSFSEPAASLVGATVVAAVTDPAGTVRRFQLRDDGASHDANAGDGVYGGLLWATDLAGNYVVNVTATGKTAGTAAVQRFGSVALTLGAKVDSDGDGVADAAEPIFGMSPSNPNDGATDQDGDGLTLRQELVAGSDPGSWDGDGGGENDRSEVAAGRQPGLADDDVALEPPALSATAIDGRKVSISTRTTAGTGSVHVFRITQTSSTDIGLHPADGTPFVDGPLTAGQYGYLAFTVGAGGAESAPTTSAQVTVGDDVTAPSARITLNQGNWEISVVDVPVTFTDLSETPTQMRLALSEAALTTAGWIPFTPFASVEIPPTLGQQFVYAQVRDAAGNASPVTSSFVFLVDRNPPTSQAGALPATSSGSSVAVPYTASDDLSGVASVELWARSRVTTGDPWGAWTLSTTGTTSPLTYTFPLPAGYFEFYTIAIDRSGNRESAPAVADATTQRTGDGAPPTAPGSLAASATRYDLVTLTWTAATDNIGVTKYTISRGGTPIAVVNGSVTTFADRSTAPTTAYAYTVNASDAAGNTGPNSNTASVTTPAYAAPPDSQVPSTPTNVTASITNSTSNAYKPISVNWLKSTDNVAVARYAVYRDGIQIGIDDATGSTGETYVDRSSEPGRTYGYTIRAVDPSGNQSAASASATVTTPICTSFCSSFLLRPRLDVFYSGFTAVPTGPLYAQLDEPISDGDTTYIVGPTSGIAMATFAMLGPSGPVYAATVRFAGRQAITGGKAGVMNARVELYDGITLVATGVTRSLTTSYITYTQTFTGLSISSGTNLRVRIVQLSPGTSTMRSRFTFLETTITFQPPDTSAPSKPNGLSAAVVTETRTRVTWTASTDDDGVQGYLLYRGGVQVGAFSINSLGYNDSGLAPNTTYSYTVRAVDAAGNQSALSNATSVTTPPVPADTTAPSSPTWISATPASSTRINLAWNPSTDNVAVQGYFVFRNGVQVGSLPVGSTSYSDTGLTPNTPYTYSLEAIDGSGNRSARSGNATIGTPP